MGTHGVGVVVRFCTSVAVMRLLLRGALPARCSVVIALRCQNTTFSAQVVYSIVLMSSNGVRSLCRVWQAS